jgi:hypothetical protein
MDGATSREQHTSKTKNTERLVRTQPERQLCCCGAPAALFFRLVLQAATRNWLICAGVGDRQNLVPEIFRIADVDQSTSDGLLSAQLVNTYSQDDSIKGRCE